TARRGIPSRSLTPSATPLPSPPSRPPPLSPSAKTKCSTLERYNQTLLPFILPELPVCLLPSSFRCRGVSRYALFRRGRREEAKRRKMVPALFYFWGEAVSHRKRSLVYGRRAVPHPCRTDRASHPADPWAES